MVINAVCGNCKRVYPVDEQYAGQTFTCETCGKPFTVPVPGVVQPVAIYQSPRPQEYVVPEVSRDRLIAGRICIVLSVLMYLGFTCLACSGVILLLVPAAAPPGGPARIPMGLLGAVTVGGALFIGGVATTYLVSGINIRKGGRIAPIVALVLASIELLGHAVLVIGGASRQALGGGGLPAGQFAISLAIQLLFLLAMGQLIYHLVKVLQEPRG